MVVVPTQVPVQEDASRPTATPFSQSLHSVARAICLEKWHTSPLLSHWEVGAIPPRMERMVGSFLSHTAFLCLDVAVEKTVASFLLGGFSPHSRIPCGFGLKAVSHWNHTWAGSIAFLSLPTQFFSGSSWEYILNQSLTQESPSQTLLLGNLSNNRV